MDNAWLEASDCLSVALILDSLDALGYRHQSPAISMPARTSRRAVIGTAKTLLWADFAHDDPATYDKELRAVDSVQAGDIVVCATGCSMRSGIWGELLSTAAIGNGSVGVLTDGAVRDVAQITAMDFPVYAAGVCAYDSFNRQKVIDYDVSVELGGVSIKPGDIVIADTDGVAVVPAACADAALERAIGKSGKEDAFRDAVRSGVPLVQAYQKYKIL